MNNTDAMKKSLAKMPEIFLESALLIWSFDSACDKFDSSAFKMQINKNIKYILYHIS